MTREPEGPKTPDTSPADRTVDPRTSATPDGPATPNGPADTGTIVATPDILAKRGQGGHPAPDGRGNGPGPGGPGGGLSRAETGDAPSDDPGPPAGGAVILAFPMDRVRRPGTPSGDGRATIADTAAGLTDPAHGLAAHGIAAGGLSAGGLSAEGIPAHGIPARGIPADIEPRSAEDWRLAAAIMANAEAQAVRNASLARESQVRMKAAADAFQRTQASAARVRKTLDGQSVQGLRDSAAKLRETVAWMDRVLGDLDTDRG